jgi:peptidoglycan/LPS O-acetylase OafA/YrhL
MGTCYRRELDGLRAVAVLPVILFHSGISVFSGGFVGVDVFFVISGHLMTTIIVGEHKAGEFSLLKFYARRARRILPALFLVILCCVPFALLIMPPTEYKNFVKSIKSICVIQQNFYFWRASGYFDLASEREPLLHTWSLAVEEQFYIFFPLVVLLASRYGNRSLHTILIIIGLASFVTCELGWRVFPSGNFYLAQSRVWELLAGSFCAFLQLRRGQQSNNPAAAIGLLLIFFSIFTFNPETPFPSVFTLFPVTGSVLIILFAGTGTLAARLLSNKLLVGIGLISYSAYLWHYPLFAFSRIEALGQPSQAVMALLAVMSLVLAYFSWRYVEQPFRKSRFAPIREPRTVMAIAALGSACLFFIIANLPSPARGDIKKFKPVAKYGLVDTCFLLNTDISAFKEVACGLKAAGGFRKVLLLGDSHAASLSSGLQQWADENSVQLGVLTAAYCLPLVTSFPSSNAVATTPRCAAINRKVKELIATQHFDLVVIASYMLEWGFKNDPKWTYPGYFSDFVNEVRSLSQRVPVLVVGQFPVWRTSLPEVIWSEKRRSQAISDLPPYSFNGIDERIFTVDRTEKTALAMPNVNYLSVTGKNCSSSGCLRYLEYENEFHLASPDYGHLSLAASIDIARNLVGPKIKYLLEASPQ